MPYLPLQQPIACAPMPPMPHHQSPCPLYHGQQVVIITDSNKLHHLVANADQRKFSFGKPITGSGGGGEKFILESQGAPCLFSLRTIHGKAVCWDKGGRFETRDHVAEWERFEFRLVSPNQYSFYWYVPSQQVFISFDGRGGLFSAAGEPRAVRNQHDATTVNIVPITCPPPCAPMPAPSMPPPPSYQQPPMMPPAPAPFFPPPPPPPHHSPLPPPPPHHSAPPPPPPHPSQGGHHHPPRPGHGRYSRTYYCGRHVGVCALHGASNGVCGPHDGPQCRDCARWQVEHIAPMFPLHRPNAKYYYCGRFQHGFPNNFCGPDEGPQCTDCCRYQAKHPIPQQPQPSYPHNGHHHHQPTHHHHKNGSITISNHGISLKF